VQLQRVAAINPPAPAAGSTPLVFDNVQLNAHAQYDTA